MAQRWAAVVTVILLLLSAATARPLTIGELRGSAALDRVQLRTGVHRLSPLTACVISCNLLVVLLAQVLTRGSHTQHAFMC